MTKQVFQIKIKPMTNKQKNKKKVYENLCMEHADILI